MQIWKIDENGIFTGESYFVKEHSEDEITTPLTVGYVKAKWNGSEWVEGAPEQEVKEWKIKEEEKLKTRPKTEVEILKERLEATEMALIELMMEG